MADEVAVDTAIRGKPQPRGIDGEIAALAGRQYGVVARRQVLALGLGPGAIDRRLARGRLHLLHRGVYAVGHRVVSREGRWMAAVLAVGPEAVLSHRSAAALWRMRPPAGGHIEVTVPGPRRSRPALKVHHSTLAADEVTVLRAIPVTTPARTLLDLAAVLDARQLRRAIDEAELHRLTDTTPLGDLTERHPRRRGAAALRRILATRTIGATITRSELETRFLEFLDEAVLPRPAVNASLQLGHQRIEADCVWPEQHVIAELDGHASHATTAGFERDRARDRALQAQGWRVIRVTWRQLHDEPAAVARDLDRLLEARGVT
jgi:very-short-patch-repair endonuclease/predicted transcriptional regulator of viral defense system